HARLHLGHHAAHVAAFDEHADGGDACAVLAAEVHAAARFLEGDNVFERDVQAVRSVHENPAHVGQAAFRLGEPHEHAEMLFAFPQLRRGLAAQADLNLVLDVADVQSVTRAAGAVNFDDRLRYFAGAVYEGALDAAHGGNTPQHFAHLFAQHFRVFAKNLDDHLSVNLRDAFQHVVTDRLGETRFHARQRVNGLVHLRENLRFRHAWTPFGRRFQVHETLGHVNRFGVSAVFGPPGFRDDSLHFGNGVQPLPYPSCLSHGLVDGNAGRQVGVDPDRSLVEFRQE